MVNHSKIIKIEQYIQEKQLFSREDKIIVGVSGGKDSMFLANALYVLGYKIVVASVNYGLRPKQNEEELKLVKSFCTKNNIKFLIKHCTQEEISLADTRIQEKARVIRYQFFSKVMESEKAQFLALAHHEDDNIETFLFNLFRASSLDGLVAMGSKNGFIVRPLLQLSSNEIRQACLDLNVPFIDDSSNFEPKYDRNKIRLNLIPAIEENFPNGPENITQSIKYLQNVKTTFDLSLSYLISEIIGSSWNGIKYVPFKKLNKIFVNSENQFLALWHWVKNLGFNQQNLLDLLESQKSGRKILSEKYVLYKLNDAYALLSQNLLQNKEILIKQIGDYNFHNFNIRLSLNKEAFEMKGQQFITVNRNMLSHGITIRKWLKGDKMIPKGMNSQKKLSDVFIDDKIDIAKRQILPIVVYKEEILWIYDNRTSEKLKSLDNKEEKLYLSIY